jgi:hypothetical protein
MIPRDKALYFTQKQQKILQTLHKAMLSITGGIVARRIPHNSSMDDPNFKYLQMGLYIYPYTAEEEQALKALFNEIKDTLKDGIVLESFSYTMLTKLHELLLNPITREENAIEGVYYQTSIHNMILMITREPMSAITEPLKLWLESAARKGYDLYATLSYDDKANKVVIEKQDCSEQTLRIQSKEVKNFLDILPKMFEGFGTLDSYEYLANTSRYKYSISPFDGTYTGYSSVFNDEIYHGNFIFHAVLNELMNFKE